MGFLRGDPVVQPMYTVNPPDEKPLSEDMRIISATRLGFPFEYNLKIFLAVFWRKKNKKDINNMHKTKTKESRYYEKFMSDPVCQRADNFVLSG